MRIQVTPARPASVQAPAVAVCYVPPAPAPHVPYAVPVIRVASTVRVLGVALS